MAALEVLHLDAMKNGTSVYDFPDIKHQLIERRLCGVSLLSGRTSPEAALCRFQSSIKILFIII